jgi:hypothetical protein
MAEGMRDRGDLVARTKHEHRGRGRGLLRDVIDRESAGGLRDSDRSSYGLTFTGGRAMQVPAATREHFQCPRCSMGDYETSHLLRPHEEFCFVCLEEDGLNVRMERWEEPAQARLRGVLTVVAADPREVA